MTTIFAYLLYFNGYWRKMVDIKSVAVHNYNRVDDRLYWGFERVIGHTIPNAMLVVAEFVMHSRFTL